MDDANTAAQDGSPSSHALGPAQFRIDHYTDAASLSGRAQQSIDATSQWLFNEQDPEGFWCGELQGDTILESEYILLLAWLGRENTETARKAAAYILKQQQPEGGWALFPGGEVDISVSVKAYFALKLTGHDPQLEYMNRARGTILAHGGADAVNSFTRFYLALLGQIDYEHCPAVPPEAVLLPAWFPLSIYKISAWSRTILVPLAIMWAHRPTRELPPELGIHDLFIKPPKAWPPLRCPGSQTGRRWLTWERAFRFVDSGLKLCEGLRLRPLRRIALRAAEKWMLDRFDQSDGLGAIFPPIVWSIVALKCLGYDEDSPEVTECLHQLDALMIEEQDTIRLQPCKSPVWDTAIALRSLSVAGSPSRDPRIQRSVSWLLKKEVTRKGDWAQTVRAEPAGWYFEHHNEFYPDIDDTIMVMMALREQLFRQDDHKQVSHQRAQTLHEAKRVAATLSQSASQDIATSPRQVAAACERGRRWVLALQNRDGGWGAFDKDNDSEFLCHVPFADHNAMIDPSTPDITGRVLEALGRWGMSTGHPAIDRAVEFVLQTQEPDGSWFGRWGVNYIYGTWQVLCGLAEVGVSTNSPAMRRGAEWLIAHQQSSGGWGETAETYAYPELRGQGSPTASQTAWAVLGLMAAGMRDHEAVEKGIQYLVDTQSPDGQWQEDQFTGTGFPRVFYLKYHLYPIYFPLLALGEWSQSADGMTN